MAKIKALLIDLSGTLHVGREAIPGSVEAIQRLRNAKIPIRFCSNTSKESRGSLLSKLRDMKFDIRENELFTSLSSARNLVLKRDLNPLYLLSKSAQEDFPPCLDLVYDSVVVGLAPDMFSYDDLNEAFQVLSSQKSAPLIATHTAKYIRSDDKNLSLGPGPFVKALEYASGTEAEIVGKPSESFFRLTLASLRSRDSDSIDEDGWENVGMVGDDVEQDVGDTVKSLGLHRFLVKTGKYRLGDEEKRQDLTGCFDDFPSLVNYLLQE